MPKPEERARGGGPRRSPRLGVPRHVLIRGRRPAAAADTLIDRATVAVLALAVLLPGGLTFLDHPGGIDALPRRRGRRRGRGAGRQSTTRWLEQALYSLSRQGAEAVIWLRLQPEGRRGHSQVIDAPLRFDCAVTIAVLSTVGEREICFTLASVSPVTPALSKL